MPNLSQKAYAQNLNLAFQDGKRDGFHEGQKAAAADIRAIRQEMTNNILREAAQLAQANAKLTYSLHLLIEKATKV